MPRIGLIILLFVMGLWPFAATFVAHHPDERHYTDAAIWMLHNGDYLVPHCPDGSLRFEKPILTYWLVAGSYAIFGISPLSSRLPFLLAGCGVLWLTYRLALRLSRQEAVARLAALLMLCHPLLVLSATRSTPDVLLCLFVLLSAYGFLGLLTDDTPAASASLAAYGGAGLAVATKGLPVLALVGFAWCFALLNPWQRVPLRRLAHWPSILLGGGVGIAWYLAMTAIHGRAPLDTFWTDQIALRVTPFVEQIPSQFALALGCFVFTLLPWTLLVIPAALDRQSAPTDDAAKQGRRFIFLWTVFVALLGSVTWKFSVRYVLLVSPLLAVVIADMLSRSQSRALLLSTRITLTAAALLLLGTVVLGGIIHFQLGASVLDIVGLLGGTIVTLAIAFIAWRGAWPVTAASLAVSLFLLVPAGLLAIRTLVIPDQGAQIAENLARLGCIDCGPIPFEGPPALASKVRICSHGRAELRWVKHVKQQMITTMQAAILPHDKLVRHPRAGDRVEDLSTGYQDLPPGDLAMAICEGRLGQYLTSRRSWFQIVIHPSRVGHDSDLVGGTELSSGR